MADIQQEVQTEGQQTLEDVLAQTAEEAREPEQFEAEQPQVEAAESPVSEAEEAPLAEPSAPDPDLIEIPGYGSFTREEIEGVVQIAQLAQQHPDRLVRAQMALRGEEEYEDDGEYEEPYQAPADDDDGDDWIDPAVARRFAQIEALLNQEREARAREEDRRASVSLDEARDSFMAAHDITDPKDLVPLWEHIQEHNWLQGYVQKAGGNITKGTTKALEDAYRILNYDRAYQTAAEGTVKDLAARRAAAAASSGGRSAARKSEPKDLVEALREAAGDSS